ncbi:MAG: hypothetical protein XD95_0113 [Microgenomates bacterium 39_7]|nr:MAG: hypothetical protein XD95_0113 [Microgenomates bacterium 39_7]
MNNIISNFGQIVQQATERGLPLKKKAILREYLQAKFVSHFYSFPEANKLSFVGGTSLRLLRGLPRFSEDLDFDNLGLNDKQILALVEKIVEIFLLENIEVELKVTQREYKNYFEFHFPNLLHHLKITTNPKEKLNIKLDYASHWQGQSTQVILFNQYGFIERVVTNQLDQLVVQKLAAYAGRKRTQARDLYDVVWLYAQGARLDDKFLKANQHEELVSKAIEKFKQEGATKSLKQRLKPFLLNSTDVDKIELLGDVLQEMRAA